MQAFKRMGAQKINYLKKHPLKRESEKKVGHWSPSIRACFKSIVQSSSLRYLIMRKINTLL